MKELFFTHLGSIIAGITSSALFLFALSRLKPKINISEKISIEERENEQKKMETHFGFKVINKSWFFKVYDIKVRLYSIELIPSENNEDFHCEEIELRKNETWVLNRFYIGHCCQDFIFGERRLRKRTDYAVQFFSKKNLNNLVGTNKRLRFEVLAKHSLSGFSVVKIYTFRHKNDLIKGSF